MYTGQTIQIKGSISIDVRYKDQTYTLDLIIVEGSGQSLLGRDWLHTIPLDWSYLKPVRSSPATKCQQVIDHYPSVFKGKLGHIKGSTADFEVDPMRNPSFVELALYHTPSAPKSKPNWTVWKRQNSLSRYICKMGSPNRSSTETRW